MRCLFSVVGRITRPLLPGFGLIEVCLSLIVLGFILSMSLNITSKSQTRLNAQHATKLRHSVRRALQQYYAINKIYPLPASTAENGIARETPDAGDSTVGYAPLKSLGIIDSSQFQNLKYAVWNSATRTHPDIVEHDADGTGVAFDDPEEAVAASDGGFTLTDNRGQRLIDERRQHVIVIVAPQQILDNLRGSSLSVASHSLKDMIIITRPKRIS